MRYYPKTTAALTVAIRSTFPDANPRKEDIDTLRNPFDIAEYLLWMLDELQTFRGKRMAARRGRWIGYVQGRAEALGLLLNADNRNATRGDVESKLE